MPNQNTKIVWDAPEFRYYKKNTDWYVTAIAVALLIAAFFLFVQRDIFAVVTVAVITAVSLYFATHTPEVVAHQLTSKGVTVDTIHFPYQQLKYFWIVDTPEHKTVNFVTNTTISREIILELENQDPDEVREFLLSFLPEHEQATPSMSQKISHMIKF